LKKTVGRLFYNTEKTVLIFFYQTTTGASVKKGLTEVPFFQERLFAGMLFSSLVFLFLFLPVTVTVYYVLPVRFRNHFLLLASLFFYGWGEPVFLAVMGMSIVWNYTWGLVIGRARSGKLPLLIGTAGNLLLLFYFKYLNFSVSMLSQLLEYLGFSSWNVRHVLLPLGISFFTFQSISYLADVYRDRSLCRKNLIDVALYVSLFPQLIAGPIVRYSSIRAELDRREYSVESFADGMQRFIYGLGAKMLLANPAGSIADAVFESPADQLSASAAWLGVLAYSLQIYFDFSGYSSMAIGLGRMFGFHFPENFNNPYVADSIADFWRRWHISLSSWFRDYVYIPLGGSRGSDCRTAMNLLLVFFLTGIWHGANWTFLVWGLWYGILLVVEKFLFRDRLPGWLMRIWALSAIINGWVFFRSESLGSAMEYFGAMYGCHAGTNAAFAAEWLGVRSWAVIAGGILLALPWADRIAGNRGFGRIASIFVLLLSVIALARGAYNPFLYFRF
jgi:alginate O-acetyltransferase complex protein AlgI